MHASRRFCAVSLISGLVLAGLTLRPAAAQPDRITVLVTIAQANAHCLIETGTMPAAKARDLAERFLTSQNISDAKRTDVRNQADFNDLMELYISDQGGCTAVVKALQR